VKNSKIIIKDPHVHNLISLKQLVLGLSTLLYRNNEQIDECSDDQYTEDTNDQN
jgi:hypothetical protein